MEKRRRGLFAWAEGMCRKVIAVMVAACMALGAGCYGSFPLTHTVYTVNGRIEPSLFRQVAFWVLIILPVYEATALGDIVILNLIEFWTDADFEGFEASRKHGDLKFVMEEGPDKEKANVAIRRDGKVLARATFVRISDKVCEVRSPDGKLLGTAVRGKNGGVQLKTAEGETVTTVAPDELAALKPSAR